MFGKKKLNRLFSMDFELLEIHYIKNILNVINLF